MLHKNTKHTDPHDFYVQTWTKYFLTLHNLFELCTYYSFWDMMMFNRLQRHFDSFICNRNTIFPQVPTMVLFAYCDVISWSIFFSISPQQQQNRLLIKTTKSTKLRTTLSLSLNLSDSCQPASVFASRQHVLSLHFATNIT